MNDLEFAHTYAQRAGTYMVEHRRTTTRTKKLDRTDVTKVDTDINADFIEMVFAREGDKASVLGEEQSKRIKNARRVWVIDPVDGTGNYIDDSISDNVRTACFGLALFVDGRLALSVVNNPFRREIFTAVAGRGAKTYRNGAPVACTTAAWGRGAGQDYDYSHWDGAKPDLRKLKRVLGHEPINCYSAIYQACMVADGRSAFAAFPGNTIHDIAPGALLVLQAGGQVSDLRGRRLDWNDLSHGVLYASLGANRSALQALASI